MDPTSPVFQPRSIASRGISIGPQSPVVPNSNHDSNEPADSWRTKCRLCGESLPSRNKLMRHLYRNHKPPRDKQKALKDGPNTPPSPAPSRPDKLQSERASPPLTNTPPSEPPQPPQPPPTRSSVHPFLLLTDAQKTRFTLFVIFAIFTVAGNQIKEAEARGLNGSWGAQGNQHSRESQESQERLLGNGHHDPQDSTPNKPDHHQDHQQATVNDNPSSLHSHGNPQPRHQTAPPPDPALGPRPPPRSSQTPSLHAGQEPGLRENGVALQDLQLPLRDEGQAKGMPVSYEEISVPNGIGEAGIAAEPEDGGLSDSDDEDGGVVLVGL